jgi:hypothetical protein
MPYDPQRGRPRPEPTTDEPAPVDALLDGEPTAVELPEGVDVEVTPGGEVVVSTADAEVEVTASGDDVVVRTDDALVEVRAEADEVLVTTGTDEIGIDPSPRLDDLDEVLGAQVAEVEAARRTRLVVAAVVAAVLAALVAAALRRRRSTEG